MPDYLIEEGLISKKDLLQKYDISYGALYRWKRKGLIPDDWFIKRSTVTGQETFFPEKLICQRMELIQSLKDEYSLDELSLRFSGEAGSWNIVLSTHYGDKSFPIGDIKTITLRRGDGKNIDIFEIIKRMTEEAEI